MEYAADDNRIAYTAAGDMKLDLRRAHTGTFVFPSCHYHGLTVVLDLDVVRKSLPEEIRDFPASPEKMVERWQLGRFHTRSCPSTWPMGAWMTRSARRSASVALRFTKASRCPR